MEKYKEKRELKQQTQTDKTIVDGHRITRQQATHLHENMSDACLQNTQHHDAEWLLRRY